MRLVGDNVEMGVYPIERALEIAEEQGLIWLKYHPMQIRLFVKFMDYKKFVYEQKKRDKALKAKSTKVTVKEIRFGPQTDDHDYEFKRNTQRSSFKKELN